MSADQKKIRARMRREERKRKQRSEAEASTSKPLDTSWLHEDLILAKANAIINRHKERPFWLSIPWEDGDGSLPVSGYLPCCMFRTRKRAYYGFLFREHRDSCMFLLDDARKELTDRVRELAPKLVGF